MLFGINLWPFVTIIHLTISGTCNTTMNNVYCFAMHTHDSVSWHVLTAAVKCIAAHAKVATHERFFFCTSVTDTTNWTRMWQWSWQHCFITYRFQHGVALATFIVVITVAFCTKRAQKSEESRTRSSRNRETRRLQLHQGQARTVWNGMTAMVP